MHAPLPNTYVTNPSRYEQQRDQLMGQSFNMEQAQMMTQSMQDTVTIVLATSIPDPIAAFCEPTSHHPQVQTMKDAKVAMEAQFKNVKIGDIEVVFATCSASQLPPCWFAHGMPTVYRIYGMTWRTSMRLQTKFRTYCLDPTVCPRSLTKRTSKMARLSTW